MKWLSILILGVLTILTVHNAVASNDHFVVNANGTITDIKTGLMWMRCSIGQTIKSNKCEGKATAFELFDAEEFLQNFSFARHSDWRLPTVTELHSLVMCSSGKTEIKDDDGLSIRCDGKFRQPTINDIVFPNTPYDLGFWTSEGCGGYNVGIFFDVGDSYCQHRADGPLYIRLVRKQ